MTIWSRSIQHREDQAGLTWVWQKNLPFDVTKNYEPGPQNALGPPLNRYGVYDEELAKEWYSGEYALLPAPPSNGW